MTAGLPPPERDEGPAEADPARTLEPSPESSYVTVTRYRLHDAQGFACQDVDLPSPLDSRSAAAIVLRRDACLILHAAPDAQWTEDGCRTLSWRITGRVPLIIDSLPEPFARAIEVQCLRVLDWLVELAA